jgi:hypothetical protein
MMRVPALYAEITTVIYTSILLEFLAWCGWPMKLTKLFLIEPYSTFIMKVNLSFPQKGKQHFQVIVTFVMLMKITMGRQ